MLQLKNASIQSDSGWLLKEISLELSPGYQVVLKGDSGTGKSRLLRALVGLDPLEEGELWWQGKPLEGAEFPRFRSQVSYLMQRPAFVGRTVGDAVAAPLQWQSFRDRKAVVWDSFFEHFQLNEAFLRKKLLDLSGGETQLVALMVVHQLSPRFLLLDEPTSAMDSKWKEKAEGWILEWLENDSERAFVWVTHDDSQAMRVGKTFWRIQNGKIEVQS